MKWLKLLEFLKKKWDEPSSHAAIVGALAIVAPRFDPGIIQNVITVAAFLFAALGVQKNENSTQN